MSTFFELTIEPDSFTMDDRLGQDPTNLPQEEDDAGDE